MIERRQLLTMSGLLGALAPGGAEGNAQQLSPQDAEDIANAIRDIRTTLAAESSFANPAGAREAAGDPEGERQVSGLHRLGQRRLVTPYTTGTSGSSSRWCSDATRRDATRSCSGSPPWRCAWTRWCRSCRRRTTTGKWTCSRRPGRASRGSRAGRQSSKKICNSNTNGWRGTPSCSCARRSTAGCSYGLRCAGMRRCARGVVRRRSAHRELRHLARRRRPTRVGRQRSRRSVQAAVHARPRPARHQRGPGDRIAPASISARDACEAILEGYATSCERGGGPVVLAERRRWLRRLAQTNCATPSTSGQRCSSCAG